MRSLISSRVLRVQVAALMAVALIIGSAATVAARKPSPPPPAAPPPSGSAPTITIAPTATLEPDQVYANLDVTVTCAVGSTFTNGWTYILQNDRGGSGTFTSTCTGTPQVARSRVVNGNRFTLGNWTAQGLPASLEERPDDPGRGLADDHARARRHRANRGPGPAHRHVRRRRQARGRGRLPDGRDGPVVVRHRDAGDRERLGRPSRRSATGRRGRWSSHSRRPGGRSTPAARTQARPPRSASTADRSRDPTAERSRSSSRRPVTRRRPRRRPASERERLRATVRRGSTGTPRPTTPRRPA